MPHGRRAALGFADDGEGEGVGAGLGDVEMVTVFEVGPGGEAAGGFGKEVVGDGPGLGHFALDDAAQRQARRLADGPSGDGDVVKRQAARGEFGADLGGVLRADATGLVAQLGDDSPPTRRGSAGVQSSSWPSWPIRRAPPGLVTRRASPSARFHSGTRWKTWTATVESKVASGKGSADMSAISTVSMPQSRSGCSLRRAAYFRAELVDHQGRDVDPGDGDAPREQRQGDAPGADADLQHAAVRRDVALFEQDGGDAIGDLGRIGARLVVAVGDGIKEIDDRTWCCGLGCLGVTYYRVEGRCL